MKIEICTLTNYSKNIKIYNPDDKSFTGYPGEYLDWMGNNLGTILVGYKINLKTKEEIEISQLFVIKMVKRKLVKKIFITKFTRFNFSRI